MACGERCLVAIVVELHIAYVINFRRMEHRQVRATTRDMGSDGCMLLPLGLIHQSCESLSFPIRHPHVL